MVDKAKAATMSDYQAQRILDQLWLTYFNDTLLNKGIITTDEHSKMRIKIKTCTSTSSLRN